MLNSKKLIGWLAGLALAPVVGWGQEILQHPQDATVCVGESAKFTSETAGGISSWLINGTLIGDLSLPNVTSIFTGIHSMLTVGYLTVGYNEIYNGLKVQSTVGIFGGSSESSTAAYLSYKPNQQFKVTGLIGAVNNRTAQIYWNAHNSNFTIQYLVSVYDHNNHLIAYQTTNATQISYDLPDSACHRLTFKVTANQCPDSESPFIQTEGATIDYRQPDIDISPVTAEFDNNQTVWVSWTPAAGSGAYWVSFAGLGFDAGNPPFSYSPTRCGEYDLIFSVSPAECPDHPSFTHNASIGFTIPCPTTATEPETEVSGEPSGTQTIAPSSLPVLAAVTLIKIFYQE